MNIYTIEDNKVAASLCQLLKLNAECAKLHWSRVITDVPDDVRKALEIVEGYVENEVNKSCKDKMFELTDIEEEDMLLFIRQNPLLRSTLGNGVVMSGEQADEVLRIIGNDTKFNKIRLAIKGGKNIVLF